MAVKNLDHLQQSLHTLQKVKPLFQNLQRGEKEPPRKGQDSATTETPQDNHLTEFPAPKKKQKEIRRQ